MLKHSQDKWLWGEDHSQQRKEIDNCKPNQWQFRCGSNPSNRKIHMQGKLNAGWWNITA
jgi:hypothetical protein